MSTMRLEQRRCPGSDGLVTTTKGYPKFIVSATKLYMASTIFYQETCGTWQTLAIIWVYLPKKKRMFVISIQFYEVGATD